MVKGAGDAGASASLSIMLADERMTFFTGIRILALAQCVLGTNDRRPQGCLTVAVATPVAFVTRFRDEEVTVNQAVVRRCPRVRHQCASLSLVMQKEGNVVVTRSSEREERGESGERMRSRDAESTSAAEEERGLQRLWRWQSGRAQA